MPAPPTRAIRPARRQRQLGVCRTTTFLQDRQPTGGSAKLLLDVAAFPMVLATCARREARLCEQRGGAALWRDFRGGRRPAGLALVGGRRRPRSLRRTPPATQGRCNWASTASSPGRPAPRTARPIGSEGTTRYLALSTWPSSTCIGGWLGSARPAAKAACKTCRPGFEQGGPPEGPWRARG